MANHTMTLDDKLDSSDSRELIRKLVAYNSTQVEPENQKGLVILFHDANNNIVGGLRGYTQWTWLFISHLWVGDAVRKQGLGEKLIRLAEEEAVKRGCSHSHLDTYSFQARGFYERMGYQKFGELNDYPPGHSRFFMKKELLPHLEVTL